MQQFARNSFYLFLSSLSISIFGFIFWSLLTRYLNINDYGSLSFQLSLSILFSNLLSFGIFSAVWRYTSIGKLNEIIFVPIFFSLFIVFLFSILYLIFFGDFLVVSLTLLMFFSAFFDSILYGSQKIERIFLSNLISSSIKVLLLILLIFVWKIGILEAILTIILSNFLALILKLIFSLEILKNIKLIFPSFTRIKEFFYYSFSSFFQSIFNIFSSNFLVISSFILISASISAIMFFSLQLFYVIQFLPSVLVSAALPLIAFYTSKNKKEKIYELSSQIFKIILIVSLILIFLVSFHVNSIFEIIGSKEEYRKFSSEILLIVILSLFFIFLANFFGQLLFSLGKVREIYYIEGVYSLLLVFALIIFSYELVLYLISYLAVSFLRFLSYSFVVRKYLSITLSKSDSLKLSIFIIFIFTISYFLRSENLILDILFIILFLFLSWLLIKTLRFFDEKSKKFIKELKLPKYFEDLLLKIL